MTTKSMNTIPASRIRAARTTGDIHDLRNLATRCGDNELIRACTEALAYGSLYLLEECAVNREEKGRNQCR